MSAGAYQPQPNPERRRKFQQHPVDGRAFKRLVEAGLTWLRTHQDVVNNLNVFPIPDGDTGTNMVLTLQDAFQEIQNLPERHLGKVAQALAQGALLGARGNSGVILSQILRGFAKAVADQETLDAPAFVRGLVMGRDTAYKGVVKPVEGTILTVIRFMADAAQKALDEGKDLVDILEAVVVAGHEAVEKTPEMLDVLREAGVVDAGGKGLFFFMEGILRYIDGLPLDRPVVDVVPLSSLNIDQQNELIEPGQDFEVVVDFRPNPDFNLEAFYQHLAQMGTAIQVGEGEGMYRMHIHVPLDKRYEPIEYIMQLGTVLKVHMENLQAQVEMQAAEGREETARYALANVEPGQVAVVAVAPGPGIAQAFANLGAAAIVEGGQTMNPSVQDFLKALDPLPTDKVILLPNNKNIILAAQEVQNFTVRDVRVVPSRTVPQGLTALVAFEPEMDLDTAVNAMTAAMEEVRSGQITRATRSVELDGVQVKEGQYIAILDEKLVLATDDLEEALLGLLEAADAEEYELVTLFYGADLDAEAAHRLADRVRKTYPDLEVELQYGGQPHYLFILSLE